MSFFVQQVYSCFNIPTILTFCCVFLLSYYGLKQSKNRPPGPFSWPLVGSLPSLVLNLYRTGDEPEHLFAKMAKQYGEVFSLKVGTKLIVVVNGCKSIREAYQNPHMNDRARSRVFEETSLDEGLVTASGKSWKYQRVFTLNTFRNLGIGRSKFERNITEEAKTLLHMMSEHGEKAFNPHTLIGNCVSNVVCSVVLGKKYQHSDTEFKQLLIVLNQTVEKMGSGGAVLFIPVMRYILLKQYNELVNNLSNFVSFVQKVIDEHKQVFDKSNMQDIIDVFLNEIQVASTESTDRKDFVNNKSLTATIVWLFLAGTETSTTALRWALLYMMTHPDVQVKVQKEIDAVVGRSRLPQWSDKNELPYTQAVLCEVQRINAVAPLTFPHVASDNTTLAEYDIPKGSFIVANIWAVQNDPDVWSDPDKFMPERFLDENGKLRHLKEYMPFSAGNRSCIGENLAKMEVFVFFVYILHTFNIKNPSSKPISLKGISGATVSPVDYEIIAEKREIIEQK